MPSGCLTTSATSSASGEWVKPLTTQRIARELVRLAAVLVGGKLRLGPPTVDKRGTASLRSVELKAKNRGDLSSAVISAGYYARKFDQTMYVYSGSSYGTGIWRVSNKPSEYLDPINNTGTIVASVTPDLEVRRHEVKR